MRLYERYRKKSIRYLRWVSKATFFFFFVWGTIQSVCAVWLRGCGNIDLGAWVLCPLGALQMLARVGTTYPIPFPLLNVIIAALIFVSSIVLLGNAFCSWACPMGTLIGLFGAIFEKLFPKVKIRQRAELKRNTRGRYVFLASMLAGAAVLRFPIFCMFCPIGIVCRGLLWHRCWTTYLPIVPVVFLVPTMVALLSLKGKRFWCRYLCPLGALLNVISTVNPFIKPRVNEEKCVMKGSVGYRRCEEVCPADVDLVDHGSLAPCTKCLECHMVCPYDAISVDFSGKPDIFQPIIRFYNRIRGRSS